MSCLNTPAPAGTTKENLARIAQKANKKYLTDEQERHSHQAHTLTCTTADGQRIVFKYAQSSWQAQILYDKFEDDGSPSNNISVIFELGYQLTDISTDDLHQQKQLVHLIPSTTNLDEIAYVYIGREPTTFNYKDKQRSYPTTLQQTDTNNKTDKKSRSTIHQSLKQNLSTETISVAKKHYLRLPSNRQSLLQQEEETAARSRKSISTVRQQSTIKETQQAAKDQRIPANQPEEAISPFEKEPIEQETELPLSQALSLLKFDAEATEIEQSPIFIAKGGHRVQFTDDACQEAIVHENVPLPLSRPPLKLRVITEEPNLHLQDLLAHSEAWHKNYIHIVFPEHSPDGQGYVYVGNLGVRGGGNDVSVDRYTTCNECGNKARVIKNVTTDKVLWIKLGTFYYNCEYCAQRTRERERREHEARSRREQQEIREEQERREQERRRLEEEHRKQAEEIARRKREEALRQEEEERKQRKWEEEARKTLEKLEREIEEGTRKVENLEKEHQQQQRKTAQVDQNLAELQKINLKSVDLSKKLAQACENNQHLEEDLIAKQQHKKELYERIRKAHVGTENLSENNDQEGVKKFAEKRNQAQNQARETHEASRKRERQLEELAGKLRELRKKLEPSSEELKAKENLNARSHRTHSNTVNRNNKSFFLEYESTLKQYKATLDRYEASLLGRSRGIEKDIKTREEIEQTFQTMRKVLEKEQALLQEYLADSEDLQNDLEEGIKKETARQEVLLELEKGLEQLQQATKNTSKLEEQLAQTQAKNEQTKELVKEVEKVCQENQHIEEELAASYHDNDELIKNIREIYGLQEDIGNHFAEAQQNILKATAIREEAAHVQSSVKDAIKEREKQIEQLKANIKQIQESEAKKRATLLTKQKEDKSDDTTAKREEIIHDIQDLEKQLEQEQQNLEEQYADLKSIQHNLKEQLQQEEARREALVELERKLKRNKEVGDEIEAIIKEAWEESLASASASDEQLEAYINRLRAEEKLLKERGMSEQALEELTRHVALAEKKLKEAQIEKIKQEQEAYRKEAEELRNAYDSRKAQLEKELKDLEEKEAAEQADYEKKMAEWEANNRKKSEEEAQRLEQLRREAEEARRAVEEGKRELERQAAEAARQEENNKPWWKKALDKTKTVGKAVWDGAKWVGNKIVDGCKAVGKGTVRLVKNAWDRIKDTASDAWDLIKKTANKIWEGLKKVGKWVWDNKWKILKYIAIGAIVILVIWLAGSIIAGYLSVAGIGSGGGILGWLTTTTLGKFILGGTLVGTIGFIRGFLGSNTERINNFINRRGWKTNAELRDNEKTTRRQQETHEKEEAERKAQEEAQKEEAIRQQEARKKEEAERKAKEQAQREEARRQQEVREKEEGKRKEKEKEKEQYIHEESNADSNEETEEKSSNSSTDGINNLFQNLFKNLKDSLKQSGSEQKKENAKIAQVEGYAKQAQQILEEYQRTGPTPELQKQAQELHKEVEELLQQEKIGQEVLTKLSQSSDNSPELQKNLDQRLEEIAQNIRKLEKARDNLTEQPDLLSKEDLKSEDSSQEEAKYEDLAKHFNNPIDAAELADNGQQAVQDLLKQLSTQGKEALKSQAEDLREALGSLMKNMQSQHKYLYDLYNDTDVNDAISYIRDLESLEKSMKNTQANLEQLCEAFNLDKPDLTPQPPISKEALKKAFNMVLDTTVPGSDLIKVLLGTIDKPQNLEECLKLAASTVLDFIPGGKAMKLFKSAAVKLGIKKVEKQLLKEAKKAAHRIGRMLILAKKLKLNINSPVAKQLLDNLDMTVEVFVSKFRKSSIKEVLPGEFLNMTIEEALKSGNTTVRKLLMQGRFIK
ncbi:MAG: hypothetical protein BGO68_01805 [Candidatus Amoebophilus sp. 36-38]|nr:MAG: hypothetical protein BGO68_01805 [Candidatus Amoebophilus sp. 36-38]